MHINSLASLRDVDVLDAPVDELREDLSLSFHEGPRGTGFTIHKDMRAFNLDAQCRSGLVVLLYDSSVRILS